ncbi:hypothetical protein, conserved domain containing [Entamoeba histolytica HM-1:IMSS]|uniref:B30.2/SPRY domain-containing protein n=6 Tax=Entamoeba histolytica TaxID=5759 RepID=C4M2H6_ENTH1|nr:uncharacterized protein EHI_040470 [Entamoeba histolytica HM-1:IMSS]EAL43976.1 hypothetical protein, conserved domain containing [Entamoeba histolytica HM-1:IMSS]ENY62989.1 SPRY domain containing protein [Entamoeba histolytica HM-1:IMSS-A]|eukprot:XP_649364.1 uncharacterized protein EHI_040470 [Entamoeba histolytica HM-1:IMSS]
MIINKKCLSTLFALRVNPLFRNDNDLCWLINHFQIETIDFGDIPISSIELLMKTKRIRNPNFYPIIKNGLLNELNASEIFKKVTHLKLYKRTEEDQINEMKNVNNLILKYYKSFIHLNYLEGDLELVLYFLSRYTNYGREKFIKIPSTLLIYSLNGNAIELKKSNIELIQKIESLIPDNQIINFYIIFDNNAKKELFKSQVTRSWYRRISYELNEQWNKNVICDGGCCILFKRLVDNSMNELLNKMYPKELIFEEITTTTKWDIPSYITTIHINYSSKTTHWKFKPTLRFIKELFMNQIDFIIISSSLENLQQMFLCSCQESTFQNCEMKSLKRIRIINSFHLNFYKCSYGSLEELTIINSGGVHFTNLIKSLKKIELVNSRRLTIPFEHEQDNIFTFYIESCSEVHLSPNILKLLNLKSNHHEFSNTFYFPPIKEYQNKHLFTFNKFISFSNDIEVIEDSIRRIKDKNSMEEYDLIVSRDFGTFANYYKKQMFSTIQGEVYHLKGIRYIEITVVGNSWISIGCIDEENYECTISSQLGWLKNSIGFHSDDGKVYLESTYKTIAQGLAYGNKVGQTNIIGIGYDCFNEEIFYTINGCFWKKFKIPWRNVAVAISFGKFHPIQINSGRKPFLFDNRQIFSELLYNS